MYERPFIPALACTCGQKEKSKGFTSGCMEATFPYPKMGCSLTKNMGGFCCMGWCSILLEHYFLVWKCCLNTGQKFGVRHFQCTWLHSSETLGETKSMTFVFPDEVTKTRDMAETGCLIGFPDFLETVDYIETANQITFSIKHGLYGDRFSEYMFQLSDTPNIGEIIVILEQNKE
ncbi:Hypothetical protein FKW44_015257 [Caligus rogercresseyi]|uniref:Uncharacterized protein n=1 Tax=Caligus rogercresseyi TaxID=217165 RepID=A0A7T8H0P2_CALRO|nr:Hypothetical protein FKW44_015257 [Caligus rogercresseyi]